MFTSPRIVFLEKVVVSLLSGMASSCLHCQFMFLNLVLSFRFYDRRDGEDAMHAMDGRMMDGRELRVQLARYGRPDDPPRRSGRSSRRRR